MKAILTVVGKDQVGIIAKVSSFLAEKNINILDLSQTIMDGYFTMMMMTEMPETSNLKETSDQLQELGHANDLTITFRNAELYKSMHQL